LIATLSAPLFDMSMVMITMRPLPPSPLLVRVARDENAAGVSRMAHHRRGPERRNGRLISPRAKTSAERSTAIGF
jgi:hypothetical protein